MDPEIEAMSSISGALASLDEEAQGRVLRWAAERYGVQVNSDVPRSAASQASSAAGLTRNSSDEDMNDQVPQYEHFAELFAAASPKSQEDKALVAGYWIQALQGHSTWASRYLNAELKNLGHAIPNITDALNKNMRKKPARVIQLRKSGNAKQANKTYKVTHEGLVYVQGMLRGEGA